MTWRSWRDLVFFTVNAMAVGAFLKAPVSWSWWFPLNVLGVIVFGYTIATALRASDRRGTE